MVQEKTKKITGEEFPCEDCGAPVIRTSYNRRHCQECQIKRQLSSEKARKKALAAERRTRNEVRATAKCPMCGKTHQVPKRLAQPPGITTRIYCPICAANAARLSSWIEACGVGYY